MQVLNIDNLHKVSGGNSNSNDATDNYLTDAQKIKIVDACIKTAFGTAVSVGLYAIGSQPSSAVFKESVKAFAFILSTTVSTLYGQDFVDYIYW